MIDTDQCCRHVKKPKLNLSSNYGHIFSSLWDIQRKRIGDACVGLVVNDRLFVTDDDNIDEDGLSVFNINCLLAPTPSLHLALMARAIPACPTLCHWIIMPLQANFPIFSFRFFPIAFRFPIFPSLLPISLSSVSLLSGSLHMHLAFARCRTA